MEKLAGLKRRHGSKTVNMTVRLACCRYYQGHQSNAESVFSYSWLKKQCFYVVVLTKFFYMILIVKHGEARRYLGRGTI